MISSPLLPHLVTALPYIAYVIAAVHVFIVLYLSFAVYKDAYTRALMSRGLFLIGPVGWAVIVLMTGGYLGALAYWLIHYSSLRHTSKG